MVYSEVVSSKKLLPKKSKYTKRDYDNLVKQGVKPNEARFICICSAVYYDVTYSKTFHSVRLRTECGIA